MLAVHAHPAASGIRRINRCSHRTPRIGQWNLLGDTAAASAMLDRLLHHGHAPSFGQRGVGGQRPLRWRDRFLQKMLNRIALPERQHELIRCPPRMTWGWVSCSMVFVRAVRACGHKAAEWQVWFHVLVGLIAKPDVYFGGSGNATLKGAPPALSTPTSSRPQPAGFPVKSRELDL